MDAGRFGALGQLDRQVVVGGGQAAVLTAKHHLARGGDEVVDEEGVVVEAEAAHGVVDGFVARDAHGSVAGGEGAIRPDADGQDATASGRRGGPRHRGATRAATFMVGSKEAQTDGVDGARLRHDRGETGRHASARDRAHEASARIRSHDHETKVLADIVDAGAFKRATVTTQERDVPTRDHRRKVVANAAGGPARTGQTWHQA